MCVRDVLNKRARLNNCGAWSIRSTMIEQSRINKGNDALAATLHARLRMDQVSHKEMKQTKRRRFVYNTQCLMRIV